MPAWYDLVSVLTVVSMSVSFTVWVTVWVPLGLGTGCGHSLRHSLRFSHTDGGNRWVVGSGSSMGAGGRKRGYATEVDSAHYGVCGRVG